MVIRAHPLASVVCLIVWWVGCCDGWSNTAFRTPVVSSRQRQRRGVGNHKRKVHRGFVEEEARAQQDDRGDISNDGSEEGHHASLPRRAFFAPSLVESLDLLPLMRRVAAHAATKRGRDALMSLVVAQPPPKPAVKHPLSGWRRDSSNGKKANMSSRERRVRDFVGRYEYNRIDGTRLDLGPAGWLDRTVSLRRTDLPPPYRPCLATTREQAMHEYHRVEQAILAFQAQRCGEDGSDIDDDNDSKTGLSRLSYPNLYGTQQDVGAAAEDNAEARLGPWSDDVAVETDDDEWLDFRDLDDFQLEHVAQAEQVVKMLLTVREWAASDAVRTWAPFLSEIGLRIREGPLADVLGAIRHGVEIVRVRSIIDPQALSTYRFQLNATTFPMMGKLRDELRTVEERRRVSKSADVTKRSRTTIESKLEELRAQERVILQDLVRSVMQSRDVVQIGLNAVAELDVLFAKAAFAVATQGRIPDVTLDNSIRVEQFVHPLLVQEDAVPVDLRLSRNGTSALVVTGMNGGGKTLALKSFGVVACFVHAGIPIPVESTRLAQDYVPTVPFFDDVAAAIGDRQDIGNGESTFTASLNTYAAIIDRLTSHPNRSSLVLLDELGSGTEPNSGGAIGQAIVERFLQLEWCRAVVTTHSPRLKTLAYESSIVDCASVLRARSGKDLIPSHRPTFQLQYGAIGESDAIGAAARADPPLPLEVLERASELLMEYDASNGGRGTEQLKYIRALSSSLEGQLQLAERVALEAQDEAARARQCRRAMMTIAEAYDRHLSRLVNRVESCNQLLQADSDDSLVIAGHTLEELRVIRKQVKSEAAMLREQGLKVVPDSYTLTDGESVVVVSDCEWNGMTGRVHISDATTRLAKDDVEVNLQGISSGDLQPFMIEETADNQLPSKLVVFNRRDLAIWDYDSVWDDLNREGGSAYIDRATSVQDSKRRLFEVLAALKTTPPTTPTRQGESTFKSSRDRKTAKPKRKAKTQQR